MSWDPTAVQTAESDTLWMPDLTSVTTFNADGGLLLVAPHASQASASGSYVWGTDGQSAPSLQANGSSDGLYFYVPMDGVVPADEWTVEFKASAPSVNWNTFRNDRPLVTWRSTTLLIEVTFHRDGIGLQVKVTTLDQTSAAAAATTVIPLSAINFPAGQLVSVAFVKSGATLKTYLNGTIPTNGTLSLAGLNLADIVSDRLDNRYGLRFGGDDSNGPTPLAYSQIKISYTARTPGQTPTLRSLTGTLSVDVADVAADVPDSMIGALHGFLPTTDAATEAAPVMRLYRTGKFLTCTPTKAGGTDGTHPTLGQSGSYSYDFQAVDRELDRLGAAGIKVLVGMDSIPQIVGGSVAPFAGSTLTSGLPYYSGYATEVPTDLTVLATIVSDHVHHIATRDVDVAAYSVMNEPDQSFWSGTRTEAMNFYAAVAAAIRAADSVTPVIGAEFCQDPLDATWTSALIAKSIATGCPLDGFTYHDYSGDLDHIRQARAILDAALVANGLTAGSLPIYVSEFGTNINKSATSTNHDPTEDYLSLRAFGAAYYTAFIARMLNDASLNVKGVYVTRAQGGDPVGDSESQYALMGPNVEHWGPYNAMKGFQSVIGDKRLTFDATLPPGVHAYAGKDTSTGRVGFAFVNHGWAATDRDVSISITGLAGTRRIRRWLVDPTHSSRWDTHQEDPAGSADQALSLTSDTTGTASALSVTVPKAGSVFVAIDPSGLTSLPKLIKLNGVPVLLP